MNQSPEQLALQHHMALCQGHAEALQDALQDMQTRALNVDDYTHLNKADRRLLDQFAYRYTRLQDDMGAKLVPAVLKALGEDVAPLSALDRFARLEQLGWLASADEWQTLRQIRNQFAHDYPDNPTKRFERLQAAVHAAAQLMSVLMRFQNMHRALAQKRSAETMRLTPAQIKTIQSTVHAVLGEGAVVSLFGSRLDDSRRGGDVDLLIEAQSEPVLLDRARIKNRLEMQLQLPVDIVTASPQHASAFARMARSQAQVLTGFVK